MTKLNYNIFIALIFTIILSISAVNAAAGGNSGTNTKYINELPCTITEPGIYLLNISACVSSGPAIDILADDVILDGNGYSIKGDNIHNSYLKDCGVRASYVSGIVIENMNISEFSSAICFKGVSNSIINGNIIPSSNEDGIGIYLGSNDISVTQNSISGCISPIYVTSTSNLEIASNEVTDNQNGIYVSGITNLKITSNTVTDNLHVGIGIYHSNGCDLHANKISGHIVDLEALGNIEFKESGDKYTTSNIQN